MLSTLFLIALATTSTQADSIAGEVSATLGRVTIHRGDKVYLADSGAAIYEGDRLETAPGGRAGIFLDDGQLLALGAATSATLEGQAEGRVLALGRGEARVTAGGEAPLTIAVGPSRARIRHGILRASADGPRFRVERGSAELTEPGRAAFRLAEGRDVSLPLGGPTRVSDPGGARGWTIRADDIQLAGVTADSRDYLARQIVQGRQNPAPPARPAIPTPGQPAIPPPPTDGANPPAQGRPAIPPPPVEGGATPPVRRRPTIPPAPEEGATNPAAPGRAAIPPPPAEDINRATPGQPATPEDTAAAADRPYQPIAVAQPTSVSTITLDLGSISASSSAATSGADPGDAQQDTRNLMFPGNIHLVTAQTRYLLSDVKLRASDLFPTTRQYWAIGTGTPPTGQVVTDFRTGTNMIPTTLRIPRTDAYLVRLDQFGIMDPATAVNSTNPNTTTVGIFGLLGQNPTAPQISGAKPLLDPRAHFNNRATFALGELALDKQNNNPVLDIRRSDQDRQIIKDPGGNNDKDKVTRNPDVNFIKVIDAKFFPDVTGGVFVPAPNTPGQPTVRNAPSYGNLDLVRKAATTTLLADALSGYARRTGQTRFVVDKQVVDISGYDRAKAGLMKSGFAAPGMSGGPVSANHQRVAHRHH